MTTLIPVDGVSITPVPVEPKLPTLNSEEPENLKTFPCTMAELCQKPLVVFEIDAEKNRNAEHKLPVGYWIENTVFYRRLLLFRS